jgi:hypothetical protein
LTKKDYTLKVADATAVSQAFEQLDKIEITDAYISKVDHSKLDSFRQVVKTLAIKAAKNKADYLVTAIGNQLGKPLVIEERQGENRNYLNEVNIRGGRAEGTQYYVDGVKVTGEPKEEEETQFKKIKVEAFIYVKFEVK